MNDTGKQWPLPPKLDDLTELTKEGIKIGHQKAQEIVRSGDSTHPLRARAQAHVDGCQECQSALYAVL